MKEEKSFEDLVVSIKDVSVKASKAAKGAVNQLMNLRNWCDSVAFIWNTTNWKK